MSTLISRDAILLALNEDEAQAVFDALASYRGPYRGHEPAKLTDAERAWHQAQTERALRVAGLLQDELMARSMSALDAAP